MKTVLLRKLLIIISVLAGILRVSLSGMAEGDLTQDVEAAVANAEYRYNDKTHSVIFQIDTELTNNSDESIMEIEYRIYFLDKHGEEMDHATAKYNGQDTPLKPGDSVVHYRGGQFKLDEIPSGIRYEILKVTTEEEMPPIHVPKAGELLYQALNDPNLQNIMEEPPVSVELWIDHGGARDECILETPEDIAEFVEAFTKVRIESENGEWVTDNYNGLCMTFANGETYWISLLLHNLEYNIYGEWHIFKLTDSEDFWKIMYERTYPANYGDEYGGS